MFDRTIDMITPIISNHVYEALLDDNFGIDFNIIKVPPKLLEKDSKVDSIKLDLSTNDKFYTKIKDYNFNQIRIYLPSRLQEHNKILEDSKKKTRDLNKIKTDLEKCFKNKR